MGAFLDRAEDLRQIKKSASGQAYKIKKKLEKNKEQSVNKMAKKKEETSKPVLERTYNIPLRRETLKVPFESKANKAVKAVRQFISKHMKSKDLKLGQYLNLRIWEHGMKNPPHHIKVTAIKDDKGKVLVELADAPKEMPKVDEQKKTSKKIETKTEEQKTEKEEKFEKQVETIKEEKAEQAKEIEKEEIKELQKEHPKHHAPKIPQQAKIQQTHPTAPKSV